MADKIIQKLYNDTIEIEHSVGRHTYKIAGQKDFLISVTSATGMIDKSRQLIAWAVGLAGSYLKKWLEENESPYLPGQLLPVIDEALKQHAVKKEEAADVGSLVHAFAQSFAEAELHGAVIPEIPDDASPQLVAGINGFLDWYNTNKVRFIHAEKIVYSREHGFVGMVDAVAYVNDRLMLIDYKTSKGVYNEMKYQVAAYRGAYEEEHGKIDGAVILHFDKESGECHVHELSDDDQAKNYPVFLACLTIKSREKELDAEYRKANKK